MKMRETEVKYFAGLIDADGSVGLRFDTCKGVRRVHPTLQLCQSREGAVERLCEIFNLKVVYHENKRIFSLSSVNKLRSFANRITKYMVVKGRPLHLILEYLDARGSSTVTEEEEEVLRAWVKVLREDGGSVKPINFVSNSWIAGFLDGDGNYSFRRRRTAKGQKTNDLCIRVGVAKQEKVLALKLLHKSLGGKLHLVRDKQGKYTWRRSLGKGNSKFAVKFLKEMRKRSMMKKDKINELLSYHCSSRD